MSSLTLSERASAHHDYELTSDEEEKFTDLFNRLDTNKDGRIDIHDLSEALKTMRVPQVEDHARVIAEQLCVPDMHETLWMKFLRSTDRDRDGHIDFADFLYYMTEHERNLRLLFRKIDTNQDGRIDKNEIIQSFKELGVCIHPTEAENLLKRMDKDGTLKVDWEEWREYLLLHPSSTIHDILHFWRHATIIDVGENTLVPDDFTETELQTGMWWRHLVAGAAAGAVSRSCTAPLDRLKVFLQVHASSKNNLGIVTGFRHMLHEGGVKSLWRGNGVNVLKIAPETAIKFMAYEHIKRLFKKNSQCEIGVGERFISGSLAGAISQTVIYPMEVLKTRLALRRTGQYSGVLDCAAKVLKSEGPHSFYRGYVPNLLGIIPYAGIDLAVYETLKKMYMIRCDNADPGIFVLLGCGTLSSTCGQLASYPLALVRTKLQAQGNSPQKETMSALFRTILQEEGPRGLYRGITPNFMKVAPAVSISYVVYEHVRKALGVTMT